MKAHFGLALATTALIGGATLLAVKADAQQPAPGDRPADARPAPRGGFGGPGGPGFAPRGQRGGLSSEDRAAFFDARLAAIHAGLRLNGDQEKLWPPVEAAARDLAKQMTDLREKARTDGPPASPFDGMRRRGEAATATGAALTRLADAAQPLWNTLTDEQKRRYPMLARGMMGGGRDMDRRERFRGQERGGPERGGAERGGPRRGDNTPPQGNQRTEQRGDATGAGIMRLGQMSPADRVYP
jgi:zinc resistance-associated protein